MTPWSSGAANLAARRSAKTVAAIPNATGRDHHPFAFTMLAAGGGLKGGQTYGETDEIGWSIVRDPVDLHDFHATMLNQFGFDHLASRTASKVAISASPMWPGDQRMDVCDQGWLLRWIAFSPLPKEKLGPELRRHTLLQEHRARELLCADAPRIRTELATPG
jgi:hypothetical protein